MKTDFAINEITVRAEATFGLKVRIGDRVRRGQLIGISADTKEPLPSPLTGIVKGVEFDSEEHAFVVVLDGY